MADQKLDELTALPSDLVGTDLLYAVRSATDYKATVSQLTSVNGVAISGTSTPTLAVTGTTSVSGANTGDQTTAVLAAAVIADGALVVGSGGARGTAASTLSADWVKATSGVPAAVAIDGTAAEVVVGRSTASSGAPELLATTGTRGTAVVLATSPTLVTPLLGTPTSGNFSTGTFTWPTFNQNTSGTAAGLSTTLVVGSGGTGLTSGTDGGVLGYTAAGTLASSALLTANSPVLGGGAGATPKTIAGITTDGTSILYIGAAGGTAGQIGLRNNTSGTLSIIAPAGAALGTNVLTLPNLTGTVIAGGTSTTTTQALFATATAGAPAFRAIAAGDLPATLSSGTAITNASLTTPTLGTPASGTLTNCTGLPNAGLTAAAKTSVIGITMDGGGSALTTGVKGYITCPHAGTITGWSIVADGASPTCTIDVWNKAAGTALPTVTDTIMGTKPALSTGNVIQSTTLTNWDTAIVANDIFGFNLDAIATATRITFLIYFTRTG